MPSQSPTVTVPQSLAQSAVGTGQSPLPLSPLQVQAANLLAAGQSPTQVARSLCVGRATLYRWQQDADFAAYLNQLVRERSSEVTALASCLATRCLHVIEQKLEDPKTPAELQLRLAFRILGLYSRPSFLGHLASLPDDPKVIAEAQMRHELKTAGQPPLPDIDDSDIDIYRQFQGLRLQQAEAFDAAYPDPERPAPAPAPAPVTRDTMRHNETVRPSSPTPVSVEIQPRPAGTKLEALAMRQNETLSARPCALAIDAALSGLRQSIAQVT